MLHLSSPVFSSRPICSAVSANAFFQKTDDGIVSGGHWGCSVCIKLYRSPNPFLIYQVIYLSVFKQWPKYVETTTLAWIFLFSLQTLVLNPLSLLLVYRQIICQTQVDFVQGKYERPYQPMFVCRRLLRNPLGWSWWPNNLANNEKKFVLSFLELCKKELDRVWL